MKYVLFFLLIFCLTVTLAQQVDSIAIKQVDSLIQVSRVFADQGEFDKAIEVNSVARNIAFQKLGFKTLEYGSCCFNHGRLLAF